MIALYGCGALVCREVVHRFGLGVAGLVLLGVAYAVWEEALVDRYWFFPRFWAESGVGDYSVWWHTNVLLALHLSVFHAAISLRFLTPTFSLVSFFSRLNAVRRNPPRLTAA